jgi:HK97 gp10 family phage protein
MTTQGKFTMTGLKSWLEDIAAAGRDVDGFTHEVLGEAAEEVQDEMRRLVPIDTGNLYDHIQVDGPNQTGNYIFADVGVIHDRAHTDRDTAIYSNVIEYGSASVGAQPYIRPALKTKRNVVKKAMTRVLKRWGLA